MEEMLSGTFGNTSNCLVWNILTPEEPLQYLVKVS